MKKALVPKAIWLSCCILLLLIPMWRLHTGTSPEIDILFVVGLSLLTFPSGFLIGLLLAIIHAGTGYYMTWEGPGGVMLVLVTWSACVGLGYWQWFVAVPHAISWFSSRRSNKPGGEGM
jgi:hypothetical protein